MGEYEFSEVGLWLPRDLARRRRRLVLGEGEERPTDEMVFPMNRAFRFIQVDITNNEKNLHIFEGDKLTERKLYGSASRKPRQTRVTIELPAVMDVDYVAARRDGSRLRVHTPGGVIAPTRTVVENFYGRPEKPKMLNKAVVYGETPPYEIAWILQRYDAFFAIDTNTRVVPDGRKVSMSSVVQGRFMHLGDDAVAVGQYDNEYSFRGFDIEDGEEEVRAWLHLMWLISQQAREDQKFGLIVDSQFGKIEDYNARKTALVGDQLLPLAFDLIYATSDSGAEEFPVNMLIRRCDRLNHVAIAGMM